ncbi:unnamed protein product, partial [Rotaria sp. Silwood2]
LKQSESLSVFYTFTDLPARDAYLKYKARALLRNKRIVIYSFLDGHYGDTNLASISSGLRYPITVNDRPIISEFILRRLKWTKLQTLNYTV